MSGLFGVPEQTRLDASQRSASPFDLALARYRYPSLYPMESVPHPPLASTAQFTFSQPTWDSYSSDILDFTHFTTDSYPSPPVNLASPIHDTGSQPTSNPLPTEHHSENVQADVNDTSTSDAVLTGQELPLHDYQPNGSSLPSDCNAVVRPTVPERRPSYSEIDRLIAEAYSSLQTPNLLSTEENDDFERLISSDISQSHSTDSRASVDASLSPPSQDTAASSQVSTPNSIPIASDSGSTSRNLGKKRQRSEDHVECDEQKGPSGQCHSMGVQVHVHYNDHGRPKKRPKVDGRNVKLICRICKLLGVVECYSYSRKDALKRHVATHAVLNALLDSEFAHLRILEPWVEAEKLENHAHLEWLRPVCMRLQREAKRAGRQIPQADDLTLKDT